MRNKKGFTLIELLAVIIILGILMIIAVPAVTKYINDSRRNSYVSTAKSIVNGARALVHSGEFDLSDTSTTYYIDGECIKTDNGYKSPYGDFEKAYVVVTTTDEGHEYFWTSVDSTGTGIKGLINVDELDSDDIEGNVSTNDIETTIGIDRKNKRVVFEGENCTKSTEPDATKMMNSRVGRIKEICPPVSETIYWALQDTNSDGINDKLIISDKAVGGELSGSFPGTRAFSNSQGAPWVGETSVWGSSNLGYYVSNVEIVGTVAPASTRNWFYSVGGGASTFTADLYNLEMCHVTNMNQILVGVGLSASSIYVDIRDWDTSKVTNMSYAFYGLGTQATTWKVDGIEDLNTSNANNMSYIFSQAATKVPNLSLDLSRWDTSNVTNMHESFNKVGMYSNDLNLNISTWDMSKVTNVENMFTDIGKNTINFNVIIPRTNGNGISNTTDTIYGSDSSYSFTLSDNKLFTLAS